MPIDISTSIAIAGILIALALGLPSLLAFWRENRSKDSVEKVIDKLAKLQEQVNELRRHAVLTSECLEKLNLVISVQRSAFAELIRNKDANWDIADQIFNEQDVLTRRALLHLQLEAQSVSIRHTAAHILAAELGNAESAIHMINSTICLNSSDRDMIEKRISQLTKRID